MSFFEFVAVLAVVFLSGFSLGGWVTAALIQREIRNVAGFDVSEALRRSKR